MIVGWLTPLLVLVLLAGVDVWVYRDSSTRAAHDRPVVFQRGAFRIDEPAAWLVGCVLLWVVFFPLYVVSRGPGEPS